MTAVCRRSALAVLLLASVLAGMTLDGWAQQGPQAQPGSLQDLVRRPVVLRGTLGTQAVQLSVRPKVNEDGLEGQYFVFGQSAQVLLAGEVDQDQLLLEESVNGKDVSGEWSGSFKDGVLSGTWSTPDDAITKPFSLKPVTP